MKFLLIAVLFLLSSFAASNVVDSTLYWPQHDEAKQEICKWVVIRGRLFKKCNDLPTPDYYWLCQIQKFIDQRGHISDHIYCILVDYDGEIRGA